MTDSKRIRIMIMDDHDMVRQGLAVLAQRRNAGLAALAAWLYFHFGASGRSLDINALNTTLLLANLLLHRNFKQFTGAIERAVVSGRPVIVLYHLYAGVAGVIQYTTVGEWMAGFTASITSRC